MNLTKEQIDIFNGLLLSDAHLTKVKNNQNSRMVFGVKYRSFLEKIIDILPLSWSNIIEKDALDKRTNNIYHRCSLKSHVNPFITRQRNAWYLNDKKIVLNDLDITSTTLMWWYLGDGSLCKKKSRPNYRRICFATDSFTKEENQSLISKLKSLLQDDNLYLESNKIYISRSA